MTTAKLIEISFRSILLNPPRIIRLEVHPEDLTFYINGYEVKRWGNMGVFEVQSSLPFASLSIDTGEFADGGRFSQTGNDTLMLMLADAWSGHNGWTLNQKKYLESLDGWGAVKDTLGSLDQAELPQEDNRGL